MSLYVMWEDIKTHGIETTFVIYLILKMIDVSSLKINPWSAIKKGIQYFFLGDLNHKIETIEKKQNDITTRFESTQELMQTRFEDIDKQMEKNFNRINANISFNNAMTSRYRIIRAADEVRNGAELSDDHLEQLGEDAEIYKAYCRANPDYKNHKGQKSLELLEQYENERNKFIHED